MVKDGQGWSRVVKDGQGWSRMVKDIQGLSRMFNDIQGRLCFNHFSSMISSCFKYISGKLKVSLKYASSCHKSMGSQAAKRTKLGQVGSTGIKLGQVGVKFGQEGKKGSSGVGLYKIKSSGV